MAKIAITCAILILAVGAQARDLCEMPEQEALKSELCVRWHFSCQTTMPEQATGGRYAILPREARQKLLVSLVFRIAENKCEIFSYREALAAMQAHRLMDEPTVPNSPPPPNRPLPVAKP
jgi:hypothetical protein